MKTFEDLEVRNYFALADSVRKAANPAACTAAGSPGIDIYRKVAVKSKTGTVWGAMLVSDGTVFENFNPKTQIIQVFI